MKSGSMHLNCNVLCWLTVHVAPFSFAGAALLPVISIEFEKFNPGLNLSNSAKQGYFMFALVAIAIGTGGIKANVGPFGAQQLDDLGENAIQTFFNW